MYDHSINNVIQSCMQYTELPLINFLKCLRSPVILAHQDRGWLDYPVLKSQKLLKVNYSCAHAQTPHVQSRVDTIMIIL